MMVRKAILGCVSLALAAGCATTSTNQNANTQSAQQVRRRPRRRDVQRALSDAVRRAAECLPRSAPNVTVTGAFHGDNGEYRVENIESETRLGTTVRTCVREEFESAHVEPFADERYATVRIFTAEGAVLAAQNGSGTMSSVAPPSGAVATNANATASSAPSPEPQGTATTTQPAANTSATASTAATTTAANTTATANTAAANGSITTAATPTTNTASSATTSAATNTNAASNTTAHPALAPNDVGPLPTSVIANCYTSILRVNPAIGGRMRLQFEISPDGAARNVSAAAMGTPTGPITLFNNAARCVEQRVRGHAFAGTPSGHADLVVAMMPNARGGNVSIQRRGGGGLLATAPGLDAAAANNTVDAVAAATTQTQAQPQPGPGSWNDVSGTSAYNRQIAESVRARVADIRACYQGQLARSPDLALRTRVRFTIEAAGSVPIASSTTVVTSGDADSASAVAQCVEGVVRATSFPARVGASAMETSLPFTFSPGPGTATTSANANANAAPAPMPTGRIDPNATSMVIRQHTDRVRACYTRALRMNPSLAGRVVVRFTVDPTGRVLAPSSQITPIAGDRATLGGVATCIEQVLQSVALPPPSGGPASVALPFDFTPNTP